jgi:probable DNA metabolism protein
MHVTYDGSVEGFLCTVHAYYYEKLRPSSITKEVTSGLFKEECYKVTTDEVRAKRVAKGIKERFSPYHCRTIFSVLACDTEPFEMPLLAYIVGGFHDKDFCSNVHVKAVRDVEKWRKSYGRELHRWAGFARFKEVESGVLYAPIGPQYALLAPLGRHFSTRMKENDFIIHDTHRNEAVVYTKGALVYQEVHHAQIPLPSEQEEIIQGLWHTFFNHIAIKERHNPNLQRQWVPLRYRHFMTEFETLYPPVSAM